MSGVSGRRRLVYLALFIQSTMCSRGVWQLQKLTMRYHWQRGASAGCRFVFFGRAMLGLPDPA